MKHTQTGLSASDVMFMRRWLMGCEVVSRTTSPDDHYSRGRHEMAVECLRMLDRLEQSVFDPKARAAGE